MTQVATTRFLTRAAFSGITIAESGCEWTGGQLVAFTLQLVYFEKRHDQTKKKKVDGYPICRLGNSK